MSCSLKRCLDLVLLKDAQVHVFGCGFLVSFMIQEVLWGKETFLGYFDIFIVKIDDKYLRRCPLLQFRDRRKKQIRGIFCELRNCTLFVDRGRGENENKKYFNCVCSVPPCLKVFCVDTEPHTCRNLNQLLDFGLTIDN